MSHQFSQLKAARTAANKLMEDRRGPLQLAEKRGLLHIESVQGQGDERLKYSTSNILVPLALRLIDYGLWFALASRCLQLCPNVEQKSTRKRFK